MFFILPHTIAMPIKIDLRNLTFEELQDWLTGLGLEPYRAEQMTNLSKKWRSRFQEEARLSR
jgi:adenine C2-methylase RlmN of 23S rRNA A2503 and tRNA A37